MTAGSERVSRFLPPSADMDLLKAELERKRKQLESASAALPKKYIKRSELEKLKSQESKAADGSGASTAAAAAAGNAARATPEARASRSASPESGAATAAQPAAAAGKGSPGKAANPDPDAELDESMVHLLHLGEEETIKRLRARGQPIRLFGETNHQRLARLRRVESAEERSEGQRNDFKDLLQAADKGLAENLLRGRDSDAQDKQFEKKNKADLFKDIDTSVISLKLLQTDKDTTCNLIAVYIRRLLIEWEKELEARPDEEKRSTQGKLQSVTMAQAGEYLKPFFKSLKKRELPDDILARITEICDNMQQREYSRANDAYVRMAIGNAPWPIGVTMVGIHERSGREKIFSSQIAHALNDETQRKWIQSIKRLMTFAQTKWPPDDLSKLVG
ncbi:hypothetical protein HK105_200567 [Polyrhizophydium stewartii]|uniref:Pre-mRNA-splicing factor 18 n=1 Tax=Polyrhizophydium stewartii TaxID=2732419 RepID=A0ABR4NJG5_9FUNG|nr:mRNA splicing protein prp18 [Polyrhizophydium stewartii]